MIISEVMSNNAKKRNLPVTSNILVAPMVIAEVLSSLSVQSEAVKSTEKI